MKSSSFGKASTTKTSTAKKTASKKSSSDKLPPLEVNSNISASVRQIQNGFIVAESGYVGKGKNQQYVNKEYFSQTNPLASVTKVKFSKK